MNPGGSLPNHENRIVCDGTPPRDLSEARRAGVFELFVPDPPRGRSFGGGGDHRKGRSMKKNLVSYLNSAIFMGNAESQAENLKGFFSPAPVAPPMR